MKKIVCLLLIFVISFCLFCGCEVGTHVYSVNNNLTQAANNFECMRKITVYNARTDLIVMEMEGYMAITNNLHDELIVTCRIGENEYKKNYIYLNEYVIYVVEDISGTITDPYHYKVHFYTALPDVDFNK